MKFCIVGIGGAGGRVAKEFLGNEDLDSRILSRITDAEYVSPGKIKGIWLEAQKSDTKEEPFFGDIKDECYPCFYIPHDIVEEGSPVQVEIINRYGYDVKKQGFVRDAQYLKAIFEIFDTDPKIQDLAANIISRDTIELVEGNMASNGLSSTPNPIFDGAWNAIKGFTTIEKGECDVILFVVSFGGGTGTGFINPIINNIRKKGKLTYPVFVLGVLTQMAPDKGQLTSSKRRNLAAISAIYDLVTMDRGANGVIIIDNELLLKKCSDDRSSGNRFIHEIMQPMVAARDYPEESLDAQAFADKSSSGRPPIYVPLFASLPRSATLEKLIEKALSEEGRLFGCTPEKADSAFVFCRGFFDTDEIKTILSEKTKIPKNNIYPARKMGEGQNEILILLRNPYGGDPKAYAKPGTLENRFCQVISEALNYIKEQPEDLFYKVKEEIVKKDGGKADLPKLTERSERALKIFFFGADGTSRTSGFVFELEEAKRRLREGKEDKPFFKNPLRIFEKDSNVEGENETYVFCWDRIPGEDTGELIKFLIKNFGINWVENAEIKKTGDEAIRVFAEKNLLILKLNEEKTGGILEIDGVRISEFIAKTEDDMLNIYNKSKTLDMDGDYISRAVDKRIKELIKDGTIIGREADLG